MNRRLYEQLMSHMPYHHVKRWLLDGCDREGANTIRNAVEHVPERTLARRLARALAKDR